MRFARGLAVALVAGCGGGSSSSTTGMANGSVQSGLMSVPASVDGTPAVAIVVDTGSPVTLLDPARFAVRAGFGQATTIQLGTIDLRDVPIVGASACGMMICTTTEPAGLLGGDVLRGSVVSLDYRDMRLFFGSPTIPSNIGPPVTVSFQLAGGGTFAVPGVSGTTSVPPTRIALDVSIEGTMHPFVLDTGSSEVGLAPAVYDALVADGRPQGVALVTTVNGTITVPMTQLGGVAVDSAQATGVTAIRSPLDLPSLSQEVGHPVDGLLGGSYLTGFFVTVDYPKQQLTLRAFAP